VSSPPTVYRPLNRLTALGLTHRIETLSAFVACSHGGHAGTAAFAICTDCGNVLAFVASSFTARSQSKYA
jgi:Fur family zinc uptake transcriptional regulator